MTNTYEKDQKDQKEKLNSNIVSAINNFFSRSALEKKTLQKAQPGSSQVRPTRI